MSSTCLLCVLAFIISAGDALSCIDCKDFSGKFCSGVSVRCPADSDVCSSTLVQYEINYTNPEIQNILQSIGAVSPLTFVRGCGYSDECTEEVAFRTPYSRTVTSSTCCKSDLCTPETPTVLPEMPKNSMVCPGCFQIIHGSCQDFLPVYCRGNEVQCFSYANLHLYDNVSIAMAGCATKTACELNLQDNKKKSLCIGGIINGAGSICSSLLLLAALLLIKAI